MEFPFKKNRIEKEHKQKFEECQDISEVLDLIELMRQEATEEVQNGLDRTINQIESYFSSAEDGDRKRIFLPRSLDSDQGFMDITEIVERVAKRASLSPEERTGMLREEIQEELKKKNYHNVLDKMALIPEDERTPNDWYCLARALEKEQAWKLAAEAYTESNTDGRNEQERKNILKDIDRVSKKQEQMEQKIAAALKAEKGNLEKDFAKKKYDKVIDQVTGLPENERSPEDWYMLGFSYEKTGQLEEARHAFWEASSGGLDFEQRRKMVEAHDRVTARLRKEQGETTDKKEDEPGEKKKEAKQEGVPGFLEKEGLDINKIREISDKITRLNPLTKEEAQVVAGFISRIIELEETGQNITFVGEEKELVDFFQKQIGKAKSLLREIKELNQEIAKNKKDEGDISDLREKIQKLEQEGGKEAEQEIPKLEAKIRNLENKKAPTSRPVGELRQLATEKKRLLTSYSRGEGLGFLPEELRDHISLEEKKRLSKDIRKTRAELAEMMRQKEKSKGFLGLKKIIKSGPDKSEITAKQDELEDLNKRFIEMVGAKGAFIEKTLSKEQMILVKKMAELEKGERGGLGNVCKVVYNGLNYKPKWVREKIDQINKEYPQNKTKRFLKTFAYNMMTPRGLITLGLTGAALASGVATGGLSLAALGSGMSAVYGTAGVFALNRTLSAFSTGMMVNMGFEAMNNAKQSARLQTGMLEQNSLSKIEKQLKKLEKTEDSKKEFKHEIADLKTQRDIEELKEEIKKAQKAGKDREVFNLEKQLEKRTKDRLEIAVTFMDIGKLEEKINYYHALARDKKQSLQEFLASKGEKVRTAYETLVSEYQLRIRDKYNPENLEKAQVDFEKIKEFTDGKLAYEESRIQKILDQERAKKRTKTIASVGTAVAAGSGFGFGYLAGGTVKNISAVVENVQTDGFQFGDLVTGQGFKEQAIRQFQINDYLKESVCDLAHDNPILDFNTYQLEESLGVDSDNLKESIPVMKELLDQGDSKARALLMDWESRGILAEEETADILMKDITMISLERELGVNSFGEGVSSSEIERLRGIYHYGDEKQKGAVDHLVSIWQDADENKLSSEQAEHIFKAPEQTISSPAGEVVAGTEQVSSPEHYEGQLEDATITTESSHNSIIKVFQRQIESNSELKGSLIEKLGLEKDISDNELANKLYYHHNPDGEDIWVKGDAKVAYLINSDASISEINPESGESIGSIGELDSSHEMKPVEEKMIKDAVDGHPVAAETDQVVGEREEEFLSGDAMVRARELEEAMTAGQAEDISGSDRSVRYSESPGVSSRQDRYFDPDDAGYRITEALEGSGEVKINHLAEYINKSGGASSMLDKICQVQNDELLERLAGMGDKYPDMAKAARQLLEMIHMDEGDASLVSFNKILESPFYEMDQKLDIFNRPEFFQNEVSMNSFLNAHPEIPFHESVKKVAGNFAQYVTQNEEIFKQSFGGNMNLNPSQMQNAFDTFLDRSFSSEPIEDFNVWHPVMTSDGAIYNVNHYSGPTGTTWKVLSGGGTEYLTEGPDRTFRQESDLLEFLGREKGQNGEWLMPQEETEMSALVREEIVPPEPIEPKQQEEIIPPEPMEDSSVVANENTPESGLGQSSLIENIDQHRDKIHQDISGFIADNFLKTDSHGELIENAQVIIENLAKGANITQENSFGDVLRYIQEFTDQKGNIVDEIESLSNSSTLESSQKLRLLNEIVHLMTETKFSKDAVIGDLAEHLDQLTGTRYV